MQADLIIKDVLVFRTPKRVFEKMNVAIRGDQFYYLTNKEMNSSTAEIVDGTGKYMVPGLIDIHMHIESSMTTPSIFSEAVLPFGLTTIVADAHEIANVFGLEGLEEFMKAQTKLDIFHAIPSSVPSTTPELETTGGIIGVVEVEKLLENPKVIALGEAMNFKGIAYDPNSLIAQLIRLCKEKRPTMALEGHIPTIYDEELADFLLSGISSDHTHQFAEHIMDKMNAGLFIQFQGKSITPETMAVIRENELYDFACLVTDDIMADDLLHGHLDEILRKAVRCGLPINEAIYMTTYTPARRMSLNDRGMIAPGRKADFILLDDLEEFKISSVYKSGEKVQPTKYPEQVENFPAHFFQSVNARELTADDLEIKVDGNVNSIKCNVITKAEVETFTKRIEKELPVKDGKLDYVGGDCALILVQERYGKNGNIGYGLIEKPISKKGAIATTWAHDHHNLMLMGNDIESMLVAQKELLKMQGGYVVVEDGVVTATCRLEVGGIVSLAPIEEVGADMQKVRAAMQALGYKNANEIMSFSTLSLPVSPAIKMTDFGMMDTKSQIFYPVICE